MLKLMHREVEIRVPTGRLHGALCEPVQGAPLIMFAQGSGSSRLIHRNRLVSDRLVSSGFGTLLLDLLTEEEDYTSENRFDIPLLSARLIQSVLWARSGELFPRTPIAFFGASTGAAASIIAAAELGDEVKAVASRGGRPDLAPEALPRVKCPTLLIVGELDAEGLELNRGALKQMAPEVTKELAIVPGATHLFEEPGALDEVSHLARDWFTAHAMSG